VFTFPVRVYYEDTDSGGVVYHANYLKFMERARTEWLRSLGFEQDELAQREGVIFAVRSVHLKYRRPARFNDALLVTTSIKEHGGASATFAQTVKRDDTVLCDAEIAIACLSADRFTPRAWPSALAARLKGTTT
jgi:acyl-CoA thioester hydrolase